MVFVEFKKGFDSSECSFILPRMLKNRFINWATALDTDYIITGWYLKYFRLTVGVRQKYPLLALLFVLSIESIVLRIRKKKI